MQIIYEGFQSTPTPDAEAGLEVKMLNNSGKHESQWFGEKYSKDYYKEDKHQTMVLQYPNGIDKKVGIVSLETQLEVDTREEMQEVEALTGWEIPG